MRDMTSPWKADAYADELVRPGVEWLIMEPDGGLTGSDGAGVPWPEARPEVAWGTSDLFRAGAPVAAFFRFLVECPSLRWFQSPAAGAVGPDSVCPCWRQQF